ncbi:hypothetical protein SARC_14410, partial [Sphaeroforma arctica JP610]
AEVICTVTELLTEIVPIICANLYLRINHFRLVEAVLIDCGVSATEKTDTWTACQTTVGKLNVGKNVGKKKHVGKKDNVCKKQNVGRKKNVGKKHNVCKKNEKKKKEKENKRNGV